MLKNTFKIISILILVSQISPAFAGNDFSAKRFLACESKILKHEKLSIAMDKEQKQDEPNVEKISDLESNINRLEMFTDRYCTGFTALN